MSLTSHDPYPDGAGHGIEKNEDLFSDHDSEAVLLDPRRQKKARRNLLRTNVVHWSFHFASLLTVVAALSYSWRVEERYRQNCMLSSDTWSPGTEALRDDFHITNFKGTFDGWTPYKGPPTPEVNAAWGKIINVSTVAISKDEMIKMGRPLDSVQYPSHIAEGYMAQVEAVHQLHCLHQIWSDHHIQYFPDVLKEKNEDAVYYEQHYEHCVDMIRQRLMCTADPGVVTFRWVKDIKGPFPDFNTEHKCRSLDALLEWNKERAVVVPDEDFAWTLPEGIVRLEEQP